MEQTTLWADQVPAQTEQIPDRCCLVCTHCSPLVEPREVEGEAHIYGYCFKSGTKIYSSNMGKGFPIYIPLDGGAACDSFKRRRISQHGKERLP